MPWRLGCLGVAIIWGVVVSMLSGITGIGYDQLMGQLAGPSVGIALAVGAVIAVFLLRRNRAEERRDDEALKAIVQTRRADHFAAVNAGLECPNYACFFCATDQE